MVGVVVDRYPELRRKFANAKNTQVEQHARTHMNIVPVPMSGAAKSVDKEGLTNMFPLAHSFQALSGMKGRLQVYGPTFLNPWLRFHWEDLLDASHRCEHQYSAIAYNDSSQNTFLHLVPWDSMFEYLKWLWAFAGRAAQADPAVRLQTRAARSSSGSGGRLR